MAILLNKPITPLRYPGGKGALAQFLAEIIVLNGLEGCNYHELFAGGCGAGLMLLEQNVVRTVHINDADYRIFSFWNAVLNHSDAFIQAIRTVPLNVDEWYQQKRIYDTCLGVNEFELGFATFYLNRTNRSGILYKAGPIGGHNQLGNYKIDARFHRENLVQRVTMLAMLSDRIFISNQTAEQKIADIPVIPGATDADFYYLDPPYYDKGAELYLNNYKHAQHLRFSQLITQSPIQWWLMSYDAVPAIDALYSNYRRSAFDLNYSLNSKRIGSELLIFAPDLMIPEEINIRGKNAKLNVTLPVVNE